MRLAASLAASFILAATPIIAPPPSRAQYTRAEGTFVAVDWSAAPEARDEALEALRLSETWAPRLGEIALGHPVQAGRLIEVRFNGDARYGDPPRYRTPHVTGAGVMNLYQYGDSHLAAYPHELVHAVLRREGVRYGGFDEEGFAGYAGWQLRPSLPGFPVYGAPLDVVVAHWVNSGNAIPLEVLRPRHRELNLKCSFQSYALRTSFFIDLGARYGAEAMRVFLRHMGAADSYQQAFGKSLGELKVDWRKDALAAFADRADGDEQIERYLAQPAVANAYVCTPGRDF